MGSKRVRHGLGRKSRANKKQTREHRRVVESNNLCDSEISGTNKEDTSPYLTVFKGTFKAALICAKCRLN